MDENVDEVLDRARYQSPLPVLTLLFVGAVLMGVAVDLLVTAGYPLLADWLGFELATGASNATAFDPIIGGLALVAVLVLTGYFFWLSQQQEPHINRTITLVLPFDWKMVKGGQEVHLIEIPKLRALEKVADPILNQPLRRGAKSEKPRLWEGHWTLPPAKDEPSPMREDAVTIVYHLVERLVLREVSDYGDHVYAGSHNLRPGDDFHEMPVTMITLPVSRVFAGTLGNYIWQNDPNFAQATFKLPHETTIAWKPLERKHGVKRYVGMAVRRLIIRNPAGEMTVEPSQIWRRASGRQINSLLDKQLGVSATRYPLEIKLLTRVRFYQWPYVWPWSNPNGEAYRRWLLELQAQMGRHMDIDRYVEADYRRMMVDVWTRLNGDE